VECRWRRPDIAFQKLAECVSPSADGRKRVAHGVSRGFVRPPSPPPPLPLGRERGAAGGVRAVQPRAHALGYLMPPLTGLLPRGRIVSTYIANYRDTTLVPGAEEAAEQYGFAQVIGVVVSHEQSLAEDGLAIAVWNLGEQICGFILHQLAHRL